MYSEKSDTSADSPTMSTRIAHRRTPYISMLLGLLAATAIVTGFIFYSDTQAEKKKTGQFNPIKPVPSDSVLRSKLKEEQYHVTRENGTETAFRNEYWDNQRPGIYVDVITGLPLFSSTDKFDAGTGRPTFTKPISTDRVFEKPDTSHDMQRTEVRATMSDSHLGHLFNDPTTPTGKRYAVNSAAFHFIPLEKMEAEGYAEYLSFFPKSENATATPQSK
jgi:methionine-R-sulfoxide reductase